MIHAGAGHPWSADLRNISCAENENTRKLVVVAVSSLDRVLKNSNGLRRRNVGDVTMWEVVGMFAGLVVLFFLIALMQYAFDLPEAIAKYFGGRMRRAELENRLNDLEAQLMELRTTLGIARSAGKNGASFNTRLDAVDAISDTDHRDEAFRKVAEDAAAAGEAAIAQTAMSKIADADLRDETAGVCAARLARAGRGAEAIEVAKSIADADLRDETLSQLATR
jgi:hypothetical protein